jgi:hypothetical protein
MKQENKPAFETKHLSEDLPEKHELAPDKSEIRLLLNMKGG